MKKRKLIGLGCILAVVIIGFASWVYVKAQVDYQDPDELYIVNGSYNAHNTGKLSASFEYRDSMLLDFIGKDELSSDLAIASSDLAMAAYDYKYIKEAVAGDGKENKGMGYKLLNIPEEHNWYIKETTYKDNDHVAFSVGHKTVKSPYPDGIPYDIYIVPIRGTKTNCEWYSNFNLGKGANHQGFYIAAKEVMDVLRELIPKGNADHTIIWTMGHSRGAAVANIVAGELSKSEASEALAVRGNIFAYTFACPNVSRNADTSMKNIYNFNNPGDPITALPLDDWGFYRFGVTESLYENEDGKIKSSIEYKNFTQRFYETTSKEWNGSVLASGEISHPETLRNSQ